MLITSDPATPSATRYEYRMISTRRTDTMEKEITKATAQGYKLRGLIPMFRLGVSMFIGDETGAVMERAIGETTRRYDYKLLSPDARR